MVIKIEKLNYGRDTDPTLQGAMVMMGFINEPE